MRAGEVPGRTPWARVRRYLGDRLPMPLSHAAPVAHQETRQVARRRARVVAATSVL
ncbi:MAG: hypothetical protein QOF53_2690, partial [Nocardioidaceae bacterium]|nr:hypothetical protein [Nocardioidaceae bacterium]